MVSRGQHRSWVWLVLAAATIAISCSPRLADSNRDEEFSQPFKRRHAVCRPDWVDLVNVIAEVTVDLAGVVACPHNDIARGGSLVPYTLVAPLLGAIEPTGYLYVAGSPTSFAPARQFFGNVQVAALLFAVTEGPGDFPVCGHPESANVTWFEWCIGDAVGDSLSGMDVKPGATLLLRDTGSDSYWHALGMHGWGAHPTDPDYVSAEPDVAFREHLRSNQAKVAQVPSRLVEEELAATLSRAPQRTSPNTTISPYVLASPDYYVGRGWLAFPRDWLAFGSTVDAGATSASDAGEP